MEGGTGKLKSNVMLAISSSKLRGTLFNYVRQSKYLIDINYLLGFPRIERNFLSQDGREKRKRIKKGCSIAAGGGTASPFDSMNQAAAAAAAAAVGARQ